MFKKFVFALALATVVAVPGVSSAAVTLEDDGFTVNGKQTAEVRPGSTVKFGTLFDVSNPDHVEYIRTSIFDVDGNEVQASDCEMVSPLLTSANDTRVFVSVKLASDLPDAPYEVRQDSFGITGLGVSDGCDENNLNASNSYENRLFVDHDSDLDDADETVGGGSSSTPVGAPDDFTQVISSLNSLSQMIAKLIAAQNTPTSTKPAWCAQLSGKLIGTQYGTYSPANGALQSFLISNGYAGVITWGATSYYGVQTSAAVSQAQARCS